MGLEELMAGLFGSTGAPGAEDELRKRGAGGTAGPQQLPGQMMPYYSGLPTYDFTGAMGRDFQGGRGLQSMLSGPALSHFARQGFQPPGQQDNRNKPGGPNIAPGNIDNAQALDQPQGNQTPGVPQGVARGYDQAPGQMRPVPQTQGWRNVHPGYSATAQYGTDPQGNPNGFGRAQGIGAAEGVGAPAAGSSPPGGHPGGGGGGGGPAGGAPQQQNPIGGGNQLNAPGAGGGSQGGGQAQGGKGGGGAPAGVTPQVQQQAAHQDTARGGVQGGGSIGIHQGGDTRHEVNQNRYENAQQGIASGSFGDTIHVAPNGGNNNTPSETQGGPPKWSDTHQGTHVGETAAEKQQRLAAKAARQEQVRVNQAPSASQFGATSEVNVRGSGTDPIKAGKTRPTNVGRYGGRRR